MKKLTYRQFERMDRDDTGFVIDTLEVHTDQLLKLAEGQWAAYYDADDTLIFYTQAEFDYVFQR